MKSIKESTTARLTREFKDQFGDAEQFEPATTVHKRNGSVWLSRTLVSGKARLMHPEGKGPVKMAGDIGRFGPLGDFFGLLWEIDGKLTWVPVPSMDALMEWSFDGVCPTPDGRDVEPDHPDAWLRLLGLV
jgi:hypothetical protein